MSAIGEVCCGYGFSENIVAKVVPITGGYRVEAAIKFQTFKPKPGQRIGFEIQINNDPGSGQRQSVAKWNHPLNVSWHDTSKFGTLVLLEKLKGDASDRNEADGQPKESHTDKKDPGELFAPAPAPSTDQTKAVPDRAADAVFYQIFPQRFRNGDTGNDPTRESLNFRMWFPPIGKSLRGPPNGTAERTGKKRWDPTS